MDAPPFNYYKVSPEVPRNDGKLEIYTAWGKYNP